MLPGDTVALRHCALRGTAILVVPLFHEKMRLIGFSANGSMTSINSFWFAIVTTIESFRRIRGGWVSGSARRTGIGQVTMEQGK